MASSNTGLDTYANGEELSAAQKLLQKHVTVEDVPDEEDPKASKAASAADQSASWGQPMSAKAAGKQKDSQSSTALDTHSHELFPELGASKSKGNANVAPVWGAKSSANGKTNGSATANGTSRASAPASSMATPKGSSQPAAPVISIPGRNVESVTLEPQFILPRNQLKRPIPDIIKDLNRRSRANITMSTSTNGRLKFDATGPQDIAQQALKDLVQQIGTKVSSLVLCTRALGSISASLPMLS
jgi:hypothetical protein